MVKTWAVPRFIGIDPGKAGAIALFREDVGPPADVVPIPIVKGAVKRSVSKKTGKPTTKKLAKDRYDPVAFCDVIAGWAEEGRPLVITCEEPSAMVETSKGGGKTFDKTRANYELGRILGGVEFMVAAMQRFTRIDVQFAFVHPKTWQRAIWDVRGDDAKQNSIVTCKRRFAATTLRFERGRVDNANIADAILVGEYGRRQWRNANATVVR